MEFTRKRFEYKTVRISVSSSWNTNYMDTINNLGDEGWEMVSAIDKFDFSTSTAYDGGISNISVKHDNILLFFKREKLS